MARYTNWMPFLLLAVTYFFTLDAAPIRNFTTEPVDEEYLRHELLELLQLSPPGSETAITKPEHPDAEPGDRVPKRLANEFFKWLKLQEEKRKKYKEAVKSSAVKAFHKKKTTDEPTTKMTTTDILAPKMATTDMVPTKMATTDMVPTKMATTDEFPAKMATTDEFPAKMATTDEFPAKMATTDEFPAKMASTGMRTTKMATIDEPTTEMATTDVLTTKIAPTDEPATKMAMTDMLTTKMATTGMLTTKMATIDELTAETEKPATSVKIGKKTATFSDETKRTPNKAPSKYSPNSLTSALTVIMLLVAAIGLIILFFVQKPANRFSSAARLSQKVKSYSRQELRSTLASTQVLGQESRLTAGQNAGQAAPLLEKRSSADSESEEEPFVSRENVRLFQSRRQRLQPVDDEELEMRELKTARERTQATETMLE